MSETFEAEFLPLGRFTKYERLGLGINHAKFQWASSNRS